MNRFALGMIILMSSIANGAEPTPEAVGWATSKMMKWTKPGTNIHNMALESPEEAQTRYEYIAKDAFEVAFDPVEPPLYRGKDGRVKTWATILSVAHFESSFRKDVDLGEGQKAKGDHGQSWCLMQVKLGKEVKGKTKGRVNLDTPYARFTTVEGNGFGGEDLVADRKMCFRAALHIMRTSMAMCKALPEEDRLAAYASGTCDKGRQSSRWRYGKAIRWIKSTKPALNDEVVVLKPSNTTELSLNP